MTIGPVITDIPVLQILQAGLGYFSLTAYTPLRQYVFFARILVIGRSRTELKIVSSCPREVCNAILNQVDRGVTLLDAEGGYLHDRTQLVFSVISNHQLIKVERLVHQIDPACFMVVSRVSEVSGRGFSLEKEYHDKSSRKQ